MWILSGLFEGVVVGQVVLVRFMVSVENMRVNLFKGLVFQGFCVDLVGGYDKFEWIGLDVLQMLVGFRVEFIGKGCYVLMGYGVYIVWVVQCV